MRRTIFRDYKVPEALKTSRTHEVANIIDRRISESRRRNIIIEKLEYKVKWRGWPSNHNSWVPWFDFDGVHMICKFERQFREEGPNYETSTHDKQGWKPLPLMWKAELDRCHNSYLERVRRNAMKRPADASLGCPKTSHNNRMQTEVEAEPAGRDAMVQECETLEQPNTSYNESGPTMMSTVPSVDSGMSATTERNQVIHNTFNLVFHNVSVNNREGSDGRTLEFDEDNPLNTVRRASLGHALSRSSWLPRVFGNEKEENRSTFVRPTACANQNISPYSLPASTAVSTYLDMPEFSSNQLNANLNQSRNLVKLFPVCGSNSPLAYPSPFAQPPTVVLPPQPAVLPILPLSAMELFLRSAQTLNESDNIANVLRSLGYMPRLSWNDGGGIVTISDKCMSWSARRNSPEYDE